MEPAPPAADPDSPWMKHLERAHGLAHEAARALGEESMPSAHLEPAARHLELGITAMYDAFDGRADRPTAINVAHGRLWDAAILIARAGLSPALAALREACLELVGAEERFPRLPLAHPATAPLRASEDLPPLHAVERGSLGPSFRAPPLAEIEEYEAEILPPEPTTFAELAAAAEAARGMALKQAQAHAQLAEQREAKARAKAPADAPPPPPPGFAFTPAPALDDDAFIRRWARECFDEIGMLGIQRAPLAGDAWRTSLPLERRMVAAIDAIAALGPTAVAHLEALAMDVPAANPMSVFAMAMVAGCLEGRDALACAERVLHRFGAGDKPVAQAFTSAMKLARNPFAPSAMRTLYASAEPACRALAVEVLAHRGWFTPAELSLLADEDDPHLFTLALPAIAAARHPDFRRALARATFHGDLRVQQAAIDTMALAAHPSAASAARSAAKGALGEGALVSLALVAGLDDARWLLDRLKASPTPAAAEAAGWAGLVEAVPTLIGLLESEDKALPLAAGAALERLLGPKLVDSIDILPEALDDTELPDPDPDAEPPRRTLAEMISDPRFLPPPGSTEKLEIASIDPLRWQAYWAEHGRRYDPAQRLRRGQAYSPYVSLHELDQLPLSSDDRCRLHRELAARTGKLTPFHPHDFVAAQEQSLRAWDAIVRATRMTPGAWGRATVVS